MRQPWVMYAAGGQERSVAEALCLAGYDVWCGEVRVRSSGTKGHRDITDTRPALPNYLLAHLTDAEFHEVHAVPLHTASGRSVRKHLRSAMMCLSEQGAREFASFRQRIESLGVVDELTCGDLIEIEAGPLLGTLATFEKVINGEQVRATVAAMGRQLPVSLRFGQFRKAT